MRRKLALTGLAISLLVISMVISRTGAIVPESQAMWVEKVTFLARAYIYGGYQSDRYWNVTPFYANQIEAHQDDVSPSIRSDVLAKYDIVVLTIPDHQLSASDRDVLDRFKAGGGILIPSSVDAYSRLPELKRRYTSGELRSKQPVQLTKAESDYLVVFYPDFVAYEDAKKNAEALHGAYQFFYKLIGEERPLRRVKIWIMFNPFWKDISKDSNPIRMGGDSGIYEGRLVPPELPFFHELVHIFTTSGRTKAAGWVDINGAFSEALANLFSYYFAVHALMYSVVSPDKLRRNGMPDRWLRGIQDYETRRIDPYSLDWGPHRSAQPYLEAMLFTISEKYGWNTWNWLFKIARASQMPTIPANKQGTFENLGRKDDSLVFSRFVYLLSLAAAEDLRPQFKSWRFRIEPEVESLKVYRVSSLTLNLSSSSVKLGDVMTLTAKLADANGSPIRNESVSFYLKPVGGSLRSIGNVTTNSFGQAEISFKIKDDAGSYEAIASYEGSMTYGQRKVSVSFTVNPFGTTLTLTAPRSVVQGSKVTIMATLTDETGFPIDGEVIEFYVNGRMIGSNVTDANGLTRLTYIPDRTGIFEIKASYSGGPKYAGSIATSTITVEAPPQPYVPAVEVPGMYWVYLTVTLIAITCTAILLARKLRRRGEER